MFFLGLAHAEDRREASLEGGFEFLREERVGFMLVLAALRMAHEHPARADVMQHASRDLARIGTLHMMFGEILRAESQATVAVFAGQLGQVDIRREDQHVGAIGKILDDLAHEGVRHGTRAMHLPVSGDQLLAHGEHPGGDKGAAG